MFTVWFLHLYVNKPPWEALISAEQLIMTFNLPSQSETRTNIMAFTPIVISL